MADPVRFPHSRRIARGSIAFHVEANDRGEDEFWTKFETGAWEPDTLDLIAAHVDAQTLFLDIGGWIGPTALYAAALGAAVIAVEADPKALPALQRNIALNPRLAARMEVVAKALHPNPGRVTFGSRRKGGDSMSSLVHEHMATSWEVETITPPRLAELCRAAAKVFLKVDIEGGEYVVLPRAGALFALPLSAVHLSLHPDFVLGKARGPARWLRWLALARDTAAIFRWLGGRRIFRATKAGLESAPLVQRLAAQGLCLWPLRKSWFVLPSGPADKAPSGAWPTLRRPATPTGPHPARSAG